MALDENEKQTETRKSGGNECGRSHDGNGRNQRITQSHDREKAHSGALVERARWNQGDNRLRRNLWTWRPIGAKEAKTQGNTEGLEGYGGAEGKHDRGRGVGLSERGETVEERIMIDKKERGAW